MIGAPLIMDFQTIDPLPQAKSQGVSLSGSHPTGFGFSMGVFGCLAPGCSRIRLLGRCRHAVIKQKRLCQLGIEENNSICMI